MRHATAIAPSPGQAEIETRLEACDISVLLMVLVQLTGDMELLGRVTPNLAKPGVFEHPVPEAQAGEIRGRLARLVAETPRPAPAVTGEAGLHRMLNAFCRETVSDRYVPMLLDDLGFRKAPAPLAAADTATRARAEGFRVLIVGAGASGICAGIKLGAAGIPYDVIERNDDVGGVWHENTYPDCGVDSANHLYCYSFALNHDWSRYYVKQGELKGYLRDCAERYGVLGRIRFGEEVERLRYDAETCLWHATIHTPEGRREATANAVISSVGQLNQPAIPPLPGLDGFAGAVMHTARWDHGYDFAGKRVAMIGTGASGLQAGPKLAETAAHFTVFQRSAPWVLPRHNYETPVPEAVKWALREVPYYAEWFRFLLFWAYGDGVHDALMMDPDWTSEERSVSALNEEIRQIWTAYLDSEIADRPDLRDKVLPDYPPFGKRSLRDGGWYRMLKQDNVALVTDGIERIEPGAIVDRTGARHPVDAIVFATGFHASRMIYPMAVEGRDGRTIRGEWGDDDPRAYLGICVPGFPNFFVTYGPNTNLAHGGSIIFQAECQVHYILRCLELLLDRGGAAMEVRQDAHDAYNAEMDARLERMVWSDPGLTNWYKNRDGRITTNSPWKLVEYWELTRAPDPQAFDFAPAREEA
ncbi:NAD(P)/FAD-dependent oxidoreductase [Psychromarinibacter sp. C21-152]|uniref:NAD(P)/FAD-dependent oxidoreductase n=1 Tax=Psychromarinibacter sediminicola TaxID=3033385 RepID=A0AAE3NQ82_9RHOB|nr:NAD(P)/FAD-dependent oxidoreductase [Psychromarinibacter sediminicola]MDF0600439.1 NAD(P)/FAD-dependent oxidoreductase [Psychromarinibacter sediminicola]